jgi:hypothetical protein
MASGSGSDSGGAVDVVVAGTSVAGVVVLGAGVVGGLVAGGVATVVVACAGSPAGAAGRLDVGVAGAGAGWVLDTARGDTAGVVVSSAGAPVVEVVELVPNTSAGLPAGKRLPTSDVEVVLGTVPEPSLGCMALASGFLRDASPDVAATRRTTTAMATPAPISPFTRVLLLWAYHHAWSRSRARWRPKAAFLPMDDRKG